jgi:WD40 repeat protein
VLAARDRALPGTGISVAFSPDGQRLAVGSGHHNKGEITLWDATKWGQKLKKP